MQICHVAFWYLKLYQAFLTRERNIRNMTKLIILVLASTTALVSGGSYGKGQGGYVGGAGYYQGFKGIQGQYPGGGYPQYGQTYPSWPMNKGGHRHGPYCYGYDNYGGGMNHYAAGQFRGSYPVGVAAGGLETYQSYPVDTYATGSSYPAGTSGYIGVSGTYPGTTSTYPVGGHFAGSYPGGEYVAASSSYPTGSHFAGSYPSGEFASSSYPTGSHFAGSYPSGEYVPGSSYPDGAFVTGSHIGFADQYSQTSNYYNTANYQPVSTGNLQQVAGISSSQLPLSSSSGDFGSLPFQSSGTVWTSSEILANKPGEFAKADSRFLQEGSKQAVYA